MIRPLFDYNWQVRADWMKWCEELPYEELVKPRFGGMKSILHNLYHVVYCEHIWVSQLLGIDVNIQPIEKIRTLANIRAFEAMTRERTLQWFEQETVFNDAVLDLRGRQFSHIKVMMHIATHEVHHIGQLSVWSRELGLAPVNCDLLPRDVEFLDIEK